MFQKKSVFVHFGTVSSEGGKPNKYKDFCRYPPTFLTTSALCLTLSFHGETSLDDQARYECSRVCESKNRTIMTVETEPDRIQEVIHLMRKLMQAGERYTKELNKKFSVSAPQVACLLALLDNGPTSPSQIAKRIMVESSTVTGIIDRLEQKGLVTRMRVSPDRRVITVELTASGRRLAENAPPPIQQKIVKGLRKVDEGERARIIATLTRLTEMIDAEDMDEEGEAGFV